MTGPTDRQRRDSARAAGSGVTLLDAHVHLHDCFPIAEFLDNAGRNFAREAERLGCSAHCLAVLLLTECAGVNRFRELETMARSSNPECGNWVLSATEEPESLHAAAGGLPPMAIIAGRQIVTGERLEILALGTTTEVPDGLPIADVMERVRAAGALCVLPWGFGKWTGRRGRIVQDILHGDPERNFFVGDNGGRLAIGRKPPAFAIAAKKSIRVLPGSDPLPYADQIGSVARYGAVLESATSPQRPFASLRRALIEHGCETNTYGPLEKLLPFVRNQVAMQLRKFGR